MSNHLFRIKNTYFELLDDYLLEIIFDMCDYLSEHKNNFHASQVYLKYRFIETEAAILKGLRNPRYASLIPKYIIMGWFDSRFFLRTERKRKRKKRPRIFIILT